MESLSPCGAILEQKSRPQVDLTLILGQRSEYQHLRLINYVSELIYLHSHGSHMSVMNGGNGEYLVNRTDSIVGVFTQLKTFTGPCKY